MDKILYMLNVILIGLVAGAYSIHWALGLGASMLIAAAPELLEACRQMMRWVEVEDDHSQMPEFIDRFSLCKQVEFIAASAIAKATGGAQ